MSYSERIKRLARKRNEDPYAELHRQEKHGFAIGPVLFGLVVAIVLLAITLGVLNPDPLLNILRTAWAWLAS